MKQFIGYTYSHLEIAIANSMHFEYTRFETPEGKWRYFYQGKEIAYTPDLYADIPPSMLAVAVR